MGDGVRGESVEGGGEEEHNVTDEVESRLVIFVATLTRDSRLFGDSFRMREPPSKKSFS